MAIAVSPRRPSSQDLMDALGQLSFDETKDLVSELGVKLNVLDDITGSRYTGTARTRKRRCFQKWLDKDPDASWEKLISALKNIDKNALAVEIEKTHVEYNPPPPILFDDHSWSTIVLCGSSGVGKTSLMTRFFHGCIPETHKQTIQIDLNEKSIIVGEESVRVQVWDMSGGEKLGSIKPECFRGAQGIILTYDITEEKTFNNISSDWVKNIKENAPENVVIVLVGNKIDKIERKVSRKMGEEKARQNGFQFFETSARSGENVEDIFKNLVLQIMRKKTVQRRPAGTLTMQEGNWNPNNSVSLCLCCR